MRRAVKSLILLALAAAIAAAWFLRGAYDLQGLTTAIAVQPAAPMVFLLLHVVASLCFVPRTLLAVVAGVVFGMWWGVLWAAVGSAAGAVAGFLLARYLGADLLGRADPTRLSALLARVERGGWRVVALVRLVPIIPHSLTNYVLGLTRIRVGAYAFGSLVGQLPLTIAYADLGAAGTHVLGGGSLRQEAFWPSVIGAAALALSLVIPALMRNRLGIERA